MTTTYYTATSVDGFIAEVLPDGTDSLAWLFAQHHEEPEEPTLRYETLTARIGAVMMGATTYEWVRQRVEAAAEEWSFTVPTWVLTHRDLPGVEGADVRFAAGDVADVHARVLDSAGGRDVWHVGGGEIAARLAEAGLLDEVILAWAPVSLGAGRPLLAGRLQLELHESVTAGAFVMGRYGVAGPRRGADWSA